MAPDTISEKVILAAQKNDWTARNRLMRQFTPLIRALAQKRSAEGAELNGNIEAGKQGLLKAIAKYRPSVGADRFRVFCVDFIEAGMDRRQSPPGFLARLFGRRF